MAYITHTTVPVGGLSTHDLEQMLSLMQTYYLGVTRAQFQRDLEEKEHVMILRLGGNKGCIVGFSTIMLLELHIAGEAVKAVFSGDTIVDRGSRSSLGLGLELIGYFLRVLEDNPGTELFYILIAKGWQTCRIPTLLFCQSCPSPYQPVLPRHQQVMDAFGTKKYPHNYQPAKGLITFSEDTQRVKPGSREGQIPPRGDPQVDLFVEKNPNYLRGDELVYVAAISMENFNRAIRRYLPRIQAAPFVG